MISHKELKNQTIREDPDSRLITKAVVDTRSPTHDVITVFIRGMPCGTLVTDKYDADEILKRLIPDDPNSEEPNR